MSAQEKIKLSLEMSLGDGEEIALADGFEEAFIGIARQFDVPFAIYDRAKCIEILCQDMLYTDAEDYFEYNVAGAWVGDTTPAFVEIVQQ